MKLMVYNICDGAIKTLPEIIEIVKSEAPDYLTLNEANTFDKDNNAILKEFAKLTNFPYFDIALSGEMDYHVAVFSKYPFNEVLTLQPLARACLISLINSPFGTLSIASLHLTPFSEDLRHPEIDLIINFQKQFDNRILMGDMNSLSRKDRYSEKMIKGFNKMQLKKFTTDGKLRFDAIDKIETVGYTDAAVHLGKNSESTVPTAANKDIAHSHMRLDYIFLSQPLLSHLVSYGVIKNERTDKASDHFPIHIELL